MNNPILSGRTKTTMKFDKIINQIIRNCDKDTFNGTIDYNDVARPTGHIAFKLDGVNYIMDFKPAENIT